MKVVRQKGTSFYIVPFHAFPAQGIFTAYHGPVPVPIPELPRLPAGLLCLEKSGKSDVFLPKNGLEGGIPVQELFQRGDRGQEEHLARLGLLGGQGPGSGGGGVRLFRGLGDIHQAKTQAEKSHCFRQLAQFHKRGKAQLVAKDQFEFYSKWYHNTIRELVTLVDFQEDYTRLGRLVRPVISAGKARASVKLLLRLGMLVLERGRYRQSNQSITTGEEIRDAAVGNFHVQNMELAAGSVDSCPAGERDISCLVAGLSPAGFATLKSEIQAFRKKLVEIIRNDAPATRVYHINFQLYPTSETPDV